MDATRGGDSWGWDIRRDNPRGEIGGWLITTAITRRLGIAAMFTLMLVLPITSEITAAITTGAT